MQWVWNSEGEIPAGTTEVTLQSQPKQIVKLKKLILLLLTYRLRYTVLINTWRRNSLLKQAVAHYASCSSIDAIHVVWSEDDLPSATLQSHLRKAVYSKSSKFAFSVWQSAPESMVGFVPRMHWVDAKKSGAMHYNYGGWWSVWWMGTYSMVLSKAAFFHKKYLDMYTYQMPASVQEYVSRERNCEDIAMSFLVANATGAPPIWVKGKVFEIGSSGISSLKGHSQRRNKCLNDFVTLYGYMPLVPSNVKAVNAQYEWFW
ncbi:hypothetical protein SUGI_1197770 [Cryptomeria japonica]|nr:hypothetical protein SUGI_1197770 [Cryptomeria japonica]